MKITFLNCWHAKAGQEFFNFIEKEASTTDVFCFSETHPDLHQKISIMLPPHEGEYLTNNLDDEDGYLYCQSVFTKKELNPSKSEMFDIYKNKGHDLGFGQAFTVGKDEKILIINVHGITLPGNKLDTPERLEQSKIIIDYAKKSGIPSVIGGDFNLDPNTESVALFEESGFQNLIKDFGIKDTRGKIHYEQFKDKEGGVQDFADFCFVSNEIKINDFKVPDVEASDHLPLVLDVEI